MAESTPKKSGGCLKWVIGLVLAGIVLLFVFVAVTNTSAPTGEALAEAERTAIAVSASQLSEAFAENVVAAEAAYSGRPLLVSGEVTVIGINSTREPYLALDGAKVMVMLDPDAAGEVAGLSRGDPVKVLCTDRLTMDAGVQRLDGCVLR